SILSDELITGFLALCERNFTQSRKGVHKQSAMAPLPCLLCVLASLRELSSGAPPNNRLPLINAKSRGCLHHPGAKSGVLLLLRFEDFAIETGFGVDPVAIGGGS